MFRRLSGRTFSSLRVRNFRLYFIGQSISISGTWMQSLAQAWLVTRDIPGARPIDLGITIALPFLPMLLLGPLGGLVVDRADKRRILFATQGSAALLAVSLGLLVTLNDVSLAAVWVLAGLLGIVNLFDNPARQSFVQEMVGRSELPNAVALNSALVNGGRVVGPALGAILLAFVSKACCFYANAGSYVAVLVALALMDTSAITRIRRATHASGQVREGLRYVWRTPELREVLVAVFLVGTFAFNFTVTLPLFSKYLHSTAAGYASLMGAMGFGGLVGGLGIAYRARPTRRLLTWLAVGFGLLMVAVALAPSIVTAAVELVAMGVASLAFISSANATLQMKSREEMRGRVMSLYAMGFLGTSPIGALCVSAIAGATDPRIALLVGAASCLVAAGYLAVTARAAALRGVVEAEPASPPARSIPGVAVEPGTA